MAELADRGESSKSGVDLLARVSRACFYRSTTLEASNGARTLARTSATASAPHAPLACAVEHGAGRVVVLGDSDIFGDDCIGDFDHAELWLNLIHWAALQSFRHPAGRVRAGAPRANAHPVREDPHWQELKARTNALALEQEADGSVKLDEHDEATVRGHVDAIRAAVRGLAPRFEHQHDYLEALDGDLQAWVAGGYQRPDFTSALDQFRPDLQRRDGIEHLVVFPMYKQNGPRENVFESLVVHVPWPDWIAELERDALPQRQVRAGHARRPHRRL